MYTVKKKKLIFKNQVYTVYSNLIKNKTESIKDYLSIEVRGNVYGGVCCVLTKNNKIGLMKIYSPIAKRYFYALAQGFSNHNEDVKLSIKREVLEEIGINFQKKDFKKICEFYPIHSLIKTKLAVFEAKLRSQDKDYSKNVVEEIGVGKLNFFNVRKLKNMLKKSNNFDLISYSALCYFLFLRN